MKVVKRTWKELNLQRMCSKSADFKNNATPIGQQVRDLQERCCSTCYKCINLSKAVLHAMLQLLSHWWRCKQLILLVSVYSYQAASTNKSTDDATGPTLCWHRGWFAEAFFLLTISGIWLWGFGLPEAECSCKGSHRVRLLSFQLVRDSGLHHLASASSDASDKMWNDPWNSISRWQLPSFRLRFWTFMVVELPKDLGPYSQMSSLSMFLHGAFPATWLKACPAEDHGGWGMQEGFVEDFVLIFESFRVLLYWKF